MKARVILISTLFEFVVLSLVELKPTPGLSLKRESRIKKLDSRFRGNDS